MHTFLKAPLLSVLIPFISACSIGMQSSPDSACSSDAKQTTNETLYFGLNRPEGGVISDRDFQVFLDQVVTPRFPDGFTVVEGLGQWRGRSGSIQQEHSKILSISHGTDDTQSYSVAEIAAEYKQRFNQEAVLHETFSTCSVFR